MAKPTVYLAGPIAGCNEDQRRVWRNDLKRGFHDEFDFIDPMDNLLDVEASDFEVVQADAEAIKSADATSSCVKQTSGRIQDQCIRPARRRVETQVEASILI